jgi:signal peptidase I, bacterial type
MEKNKSRLKEAVINAAELVFVAGITFVIFTYIVKPISIDGSSMRPTVADKDLAIVDTIGLKSNGVERFDVVIVDSDRLQDHLIKRVIGLPGETIEYKNDKLYVNEQYVAEPFLDKEFMELSKQESKKTLFTNDFRITLLDNEYFVMGDNRLHSEDSRALGAFRVDEFVGKNGFVIFPFSHFGWIK